MEVFALFGGGSGKTLVNVALYISPVGIFLDKVLIIGNLIAQRVKLLIFFTGDTGIICDPHGYVIDRL